MAIENSRAVRHQRRGPADLWLQYLEALRADELDIFDAVLARALVKLREGSAFVFGGGDHELATTAMRHASFTTILVEGTFSLDTKARFEALWRIIEPGVDHLAVPG